MPELHSSRPQEQDVLDVEHGVKPAALVGDRAATLANGLGLVVYKVPAGTFSLSSLKEKLKWVVCRKGEERLGTRVLDVLERYPLSKGRPASFHKELGSSLGYSKEDTDYFVEKFLPDNLS